MEQQQKDTGYKIENILLIESTFSRKMDISFEGKPFNNQINVEKESYDVKDFDNKFAVGLTLQFTAHLSDEESAFMIKVKMLGIFERLGEPPVPLEIFKDVNGPAIIYPFVREHVSSLTLKAGIGNVILPAVNFKI